MSKLFSIFEKRNLKSLSSIFAIIKYPKNWELLSESIKRQCNWTCQKCGWIPKPYQRGFLHVHHKIPLSQGGTNDPLNLICYCKKCHESEHPHMMQSKQSKSINSKK